MTKFKTGRTYSVRSTGDHECIFSFTVLKRTARFMTIRDKNGRDDRRVGVQVSDYFDGAEIAYPLGRYSMCPIIRADRKAVS